MEFLGLSRCSLAQAASQDRKYLSEELLKTNGEWVAVGNVLSATARTPPAQIKDLLLALR